jgi:hypothetical protein
VYDTVLVDPGTWVQGIDFNGKSIVVGSLFLTTGEISYISGTVIDGNNTSSVVSFSGGEDSTTVLCGFTLQNGSAEMGGGVFCEDASPTLKNLIIHNNSGVSDGGGIALFGSSVLIEEVTIQGNTAEVGAGVYCAESDLSLLNVNVSNNTASREGGGFQVHYSNLQIDSCTIANNQAQDGSGGGLQCLNDEGSEDTFEIVVTNTDFTANSSTQSSGGMAVIGNITPYSTTINILIDKCEFRDNISDYYCGLRITGESINFTLARSSFIRNESFRWAAGAGFSSFCTGEVSNCLFFDNGASTEEEGWNSGGATVWSAAQVDFINCTFVDNWAAYGAGLTVGGGGIATATNCIFWGNSEDQIAITTWDNVGSTLSVSYCDLEEGQDDININDEMSTLLWGEGNIELEPYFVEWEEGDFHLSDYSLCIGAGTSEGAPSTDIEGNPRPDPAESNPDMGAYENSRAEPLHSTISVSTDTIYMKVDDSGMDSTKITLSNIGTSDLNYYVNTDLLTVTDNSNYGLTFDGSVKTVEIANPDSFDLTTDFTMMAWIKTGSSGTIFAKSNAQDVPGPKSLFVGNGILSNTGVLTFDIGWTGGVSGERVINDSIWHHVAITAEQNGMAMVKLYVDGEPDGEAELDIAEYSEEGFGFRLGFDGREPHEFPNYNGMLDEVSVWDRAVSQEEIKAIMSDGFTGKESGVTAYWPMDEGSGTMCEDLSPNGYNGTLLNDPVWDISNAPLNSWFTCKPTSGVISEGSQSDISVNVDIKGLDKKKYIAKLVFTSNDPFNPRMITPFRIDDVTGLSDKLENIFPTTYQLSQNYPNPFNPRTIINYELPITNFVDLSIYNYL